MRVRGVRAAGAAEGGKAWNLCMSRRVGVGGHGVFASVGWAGSVWMEQLRGCEWVGSGRGARERSGCIDGVGGEHVNGAVELMELAGGM
eukprot:359956-Chlamydomonas_euryale.AAC.7